MSRLAARAELIKLAGTLEVEPQALDFLGGIPADQLRGLRAAIYELMFNEDRELFRRLGRAVSRMPVGAAIALAQRVGPRLTARIVAEMPSRPAAAIGARLPTAFGADVATYLDPRRTHDVIRQLPHERVIAVAREVIERGDYITMSRFVDFLDDDVIRAVVDSVEDEGVLLRIAFFMGSKNRLDHLVHLLPTERLQALVFRVERDPEQLLSPFLSLLIHVSYSLKRELGDFAAAQDESVLGAYVRAAHEQGLWPDMLPVVAAMSDSARERVVNLPILREHGVQESIIAAADDHDLWGIVLPLVARMDDTNREAVAGIVAGRPPATLENAADAALMGEQWDVVLDLARRMPPDNQARLGAIVRGLGEVDPELRRQLEDRAQAIGLVSG